MIMSTRCRIMGAFFLWVTILLSRHASAAPAECSLVADPASPPPLPPWQDVCGGGSVPGNALQYFDALAWQTFKLLVWPASPHMRGEPDRGRHITDTSWPLTFETYKAKWEIFQPDAAKPDGWNTWPAAARPCKDQPPIDSTPMVLASFHEFGVIDEPRHGELANALVARNSTFVRYLAAFNKAEFDTILQGRLYDPTTVAGLPAEPPSGAFAPYGAITIKTSWVELRDDDPPDRHIDPARSFWRPAWVQNPDDGTCRVTKFALVGMHIVHKTPSRPQWIWATFEHVDNVPGGCNSSAGPYTFNDGTQATPKAGDNAPGDWQFPHPKPTPYNVERRQVIENDTCQINAQWQQELHRLGSVWQYYQLVMTQWPSIPSSPGDDATVVSPTCGGHANTATANVTMETFFQQPAACYNYGRDATCMSCHNVVHETDFVFAIKLNRAQSPTERVTPRARQQTLDALSGFIGSTKGADGR